jgi:hypothetical protein
MAIAQLQAALKVIPYDVDKLSLCTCGHRFHRHIAPGGGPCIYPRCACNQFEEVKK